MDELEKLIGKSIFEIDEDIFTDLNVKTAILGYKYKNCGKRYPADTLKLYEIDFDNVISFDELIDFRKILILWHFNDIITDLEIFDISPDIDSLKSDYHLILNKINDGKMADLRQGDTKFLAAGRLNETLLINNKRVNKREFVFTKFYLQKILDEIKIIL